MFRIFLVGGALVSANAAETTVVTEASPSGRWVVEFADNACQAAQPFNLSGSEGVFAIKPRPASEYTNLLLLVPDSVGNLRGKNVWVGPHRIEAKGMVEKESSNSGQRLYDVQLTRAEQSRLVETGEVRVTTGKATLRFAPSGLPEVQKTLEGCITDLLEAWGMSKEVQAKLASFPEPPDQPTGYIRASDYPASAIRRRASGDVEGRLTVDASGRPTACQVIKTSGHSDLDAVSCAIFVKRARFAPARLKDGTAVVSPYVFALSWRMQ